MIKKLLLSGLIFILLVSFTSADYYNELINTTGWTTYKSNANCQVDVQTANWTINTGREGLTSYVRVLSWDQSGADGIAYMEMTDPTTFNNGSNISYLKYSNHYWYDYGDYDQYSYTKFSLYNSTDSLLTTIYEYDYYIDYPFPANDASNTYLKMPGWDNITSNAEFPTREDFVNYNIIAMAKANNTEPNWTLIETNVAKIKIMFYGFNDKGSNVQFMNNLKITNHWWNTSYDHKIPVTNVPNVNITLNLNGTAGFFGQRAFINPSTCSDPNRISVYYKSSNTTDYKVVCLDTTEMVWSDNSLIAYYKSDINGSYPDETGVNNGTISGATFTSSGQINGAYSFDGTDDYVGITHDDIPFPLTLNVWIKSSDFGNAAGAYKTVLSKGSTWDSNTNFAFGVRDTTGTDERTVFMQWRNSGTIYGTELNAPYDLSDDTYHMLTSTVQSNGDLELFVDGSSIGTDGSNNNFSATNHNIRIGTYSGTQSPNAAYFKGVIDEPDILNRALTTTEISAYYNNTKDGFTAVTLGTIETAPNSCTYSGSGVWSIKGGDNCSLVSTIGDASQLMVSGVGTTTISSVNVTNFNPITIIGHTLRIIGGILRVN